MTPAVVEHLRAEAHAKAEARLAEIEQRKKRYDTDLEAFAADCLSILPKTGGDVLLRFNSVQRKLHERLEAQRRRTRRVRAIVVKARKQGVSTYVQARFYQRVSRNKGVRAFILTHQDDATKEIFDIADRFQRGNPHAPHVGESNSKALSFDQLDSGYAVATCGAKAVGRSKTPHLFHWSEVAHSPHAEEHATGALQAVPDAPDTEIILESTANGISGLFYNMAQAAKAGDSKYELIFFAWFESEEYTTEAPKGWRPPPEFLEYALLHKLSRAQLYWAYEKNAELAAIDKLDPQEICWRFRQEYPSTVDEAFRASRIGRFIRSEIVLRARKHVARKQDGFPIILGCDFATGGGGEGGGDANVFIDRQGRKAGGHVYERFRETNAVVVASRLAAVIDRIKPAMCFLDTGGGGAQVYDILCDRGYRNVLTLINFGSSARDDRKYANKRAEMWGDGRDWLNDPGGAQIPDEDLLDGELTAPKGKPDGMSRTALERKEIIRKEFGASPDGADALMLTFAERVRRTEQNTGSAGLFQPADSRAGY